MASTKIYADRYECLRPLGEGGMATVYLALDLKLNRQVAIKIMHDHMRKKDDLRVRFRQEAFSASKLLHKNILGIYDFSGVDSEDLWIVTEYIEGYDLSRYSKKYHDRKMNPFVVTAIVREIAIALAEAHKHGIIHRDIKPSNIMISKNGQIKLTDFGIAKDLSMTDFTNVGTFMGSPSYMSPEQIKGLKVDVRSDLYTLCILFYELMTGVLPFTGASTPEIISKVLNRDATPAKEMDYTIPTFISDFISKGLSKDINQRHQSSYDIQVILDQYLREHGLGDSGIELEKMFESPKKYQKKLEKLGLTRTLYNKDKYKTIQQTMLNNLNESEKAYQSLLKKIQKLSSDPDQKMTQKNNSYDFKKDKNNTQAEIVEKVLEKKPGKLDNFAKVDTPKQKKKHSQNRERESWKQVRAKTPSTQRRKEKKRHNPIQIQQRAHLKNQKGTKKTSEYIKYFTAFIFVGVSLGLLLFSYAVATKKVEIDSIKKRFPIIISLFKTSDRQDKKTKEIPRVDTVESQPKIRRLKDKPQKSPKTKTALRKEQSPTNTSEKTTSKKQSKGTKTEPIILRNRDKKVQTPPIQSHQKTNKDRKVVKKPLNSNKKSLSSIPIAPPNPPKKQRNQPTIQRKAVDGFLTAQVQPNARVMINNNFKGLSKNIFDEKKNYSLKKGKYKISILKKGYKEYEKNIVIRSNEKTDLGVIKLQKIKTYKISLNSDSGTDLKIFTKDGNLIRSIRLNNRSTTIELPEGTYRIKAEKNQKSITRSISLPSIYGDVSINLDFDENY